MDIEIKNIPFHTDQRGVIAELLTSDDIEKHDGLFGHLFFVTFESNKSIRGNHYHKKTHEYYILLSGKIKVQLVDINSKNKKGVILSSNKKGIPWLRIGPNIAHACYSLSSKAVMIGYFSKSYNKGADTTHYKLIKK